MSETWQVYDKLEIPLKKTRGFTEQQNYSSSSREGTHPDISNDVAFALNVETRRKLGGWLLW